MSTLFVFVCRREAQELEEEMVYSDGQLSLLLQVAFCESPDVLCSKVESRELVLFPHASVIVWSAPHILIISGQ